MRSFRYAFQTANETFRYDYTIGAEPPAAQDFPHWTSIEFADCPGCRLQGHEHCLAAIQLIEPIKLLDKLVSYDDVTVTVEAPERTYCKETNAQGALSSLFGLVIATSGCPSFEFLKGLAWYHLPFASYEETLFRAVSGYFVLHYMHNRSVAPDQVIGEIQAQYDKVREANLIISKRLKAGVSTQSDSPMNALIILDSFGALVPMSVGSGLDDLRSIFL